MSNKSVGWALEQDGLSPTLKLVLIVMADAAGDTGLAFSSNSTICKQAGFSKEDTVADAQKKLCELNLLADTGRRTGRTGRVKVFQLPIAACKVTPHEEDLMCFGNPAPNGSLNSSESPANHPPITRLAGNALIEELGTKEKARSPRSFQKPSLEEVVAFCESLKLPKSDGEAFYWGKEGNGWKNGSNPVKDWKATIRQWKSAGYHPSQKRGGQGFAQQPSGLPPRRVVNGNY